MSAHVGIDPLIEEARDRRRRRWRWIVLAALIVTVVAAGLSRGFGLGGGLSGSSGAYSSADSVAAVGSECGHSVLGHGFHVFSCMSGGAAAGHPHPKELLVVRADGSTVAYPAFRVGGLAVRSGEVVATYDVSLVRVTSNRLIPLVTTGELASVLHTSRTAIMDLYDVSVDAHGDVYFVASVLRRPGGPGPGCRNLLVERTARGAIREVRASISRGDICS